MIIASIFVLQLQAKAEALAHEALGGLDAGNLRGRGGEDQGQGGAGGDGKGDDNPKAGEV